MLAATKLLSWQNVFVATNTCLFLSLQKTCFVGKKTCLSRQNVCNVLVTFVATNVLLRQKYVCRDKHTFVATKHVFCRATNTYLLTKPFVSTKMILVAAPANGIFWPWPAHVLYQSLVVSELPRDRLTIVCRVGVTARQTDHRLSCRGFERQTGHCPKDLRFPAMFRQTVVTDGTRKDQSQRTQLIGFFLVLEV